MLLLQGALWQCLLVLSQHPNIFQMHIIKNLMFSVKSITLLCTGFWSPYLVQNDAVVCYSTANITWNLCPSEFWHPNTLTHCGSCTKSDFGTMDWNGKNGLFYHAQTCKGSKKSVDSGKQWPPLLVTSYTTTIIGNCACRPPERLATSSCGWALSAVPLQLFLLGLSSLLLFLACGAPYTLAFLTLSFCLLPPCVGANISCILLQTSPSPTNTNLPLVCRAMVAWRGPMVGLEVAHI